MKLLDFSIISCSASSWSYNSSHFPPRRTKEVELKVNFWYGAHKVLVIGNILLKPDYAKEVRF